VGKEKLAVVHRILSARQATICSDGTAVPSGYEHFSYAYSLSEFGEPHRLPRSGGNLLLRPIPGTPNRDGTGCYPLFCCRDWSALGEDIAELRADLVSVSLVADPFGPLSPAELAQCFPDVARPFKDHYVVDLSLDPAEFIAPHHLRNARKGLRTLRVEFVREPVRLLDDWVRLYGSLTERHGLEGIHRFSPAAFERQLQVPGCRALAAYHRGTVVGMLLWYEQGTVAYYHLGAFDEQGYELRASFALFRTAIDAFAAADLRWLCLGGVAGVEASAESGLARFKRGWATGTRTAYFCGRILDPERYALLSRKQPASGFFPLYRQRAAAGEPVIRPEAAS
jgi:hypothetical protein